MTDLRALIRELLAEELTHLRQGAAVPQVRTEVVSLRTNGELDAFVRRLLALAQDSRARDAIETGHHVFALADGRPGGGRAVADASPEPSRSAARSPETPHFERGLVTERHIAALCEGATRIRVGPAARFTPLARDELRRRNVRIERMQQ